METYEYTVYHKIFGELILYKSMNYEEHWSVF